MPSQTTNKARFKVLMAAARKGDLDAMARVEFKKPEVLQFTTDSGLTALMEAAIHQQIKSIEWLIPRINPNAVDNQGRNALMLSIRDHASVESTEALLPYTDVNAQDRMGYTALMYAANYSNAVALERLLPLSNPNLLNKKNQTALMIAVQKNEWSAGVIAINCVEVLTRRSDLTLKSKVGRKWVTPEEFVQLEEKQRMTHAFVKGRSHQEADMIAEISQEALTQQESSFETGERASKPRSSLRKGL